MSMLTTSTTAKSAIGKEPQNVDVSKRIALVGGAGFIGHNLALALKDRDICY